MSPRAVSYSDVVSAYGVVSVHFVTAASSDSEQLLPRLSLCNAGSLHLGYVVARLDLSLARVANWLG